MDNMFEDSAHAFAYKSDGELRNAFWMFRAMGFNRLVSLGSKMILGAIRWNLPVSGILKHTLYDQFVGGETLGKATPVVEKLGGYQVDVILDYGAEAKTGESNFDFTKDEFIKAIAYAGGQKNVPFISLKITALARFGLLEKLNDKVVMLDDRILVDTSGLAHGEAEEWARVMERTFAICRAATDHRVGVLIDAEESWIQNTIDAVAMLAMQACNRGQVTVFNTIQLYRHDKLAFLKKSHEIAGKLNFELGVKLVRGAYMEKEAAWAAVHNIATVIQPDKESTDRDYNEAVRYCLENLIDIAVVVATHNEFSTSYTTKKLRERLMRADSGRVFFSQLYGMSDNITFNLAREGYSTSKYVPYGPVKDVIPYLLRRAQENSSVAGQTGREAFLLEKEMRRRRIAPFFVF